MFVTLSAAKSLFVVALFYTITMSLKQKLAQTRGEDLLHAVPPELRVKITFDARLLG